VGSGGILPRRLESFKGGEKREVILDMITNLAHDRNEFKWQIVSYIYEAFIIQSLVLPSIEFLFKALLNIGGALVLLRLINSMFN
jgi:hypothetical protein